MRGSKLEVADIFRDHGAAYRAANKGHISLNQLKVMSAIEQCRTAMLGGHVARCEKCAHEHIAYNSCRNRHCPKCQSGAAKAWLADREADVLPVRYFHLVFTLPKPISDIAHQNKRALYNLLMRVSADTVIKIAKDQKHLGARVGMTSVLHTWGSATTHHPHVHMIVPSGGLSADGAKWFPSRKNFFLSVRVLSSLYRRLILEGLVKLHNAGKLKFFGDHAELTDKTAFEAFLKPLVKNYRVNGSGRHTTMTLNTAEFIRRFLIHVLPKGQHRIRHYGFMGNGNRAANVAKIRELLDAKAPRKDQREDEAANGTDEQSRVLALPCPCCGGRLIIIECLPPGCPPRAPPDPRKAAA